MKLVDQTNHPVKINNNELRIVSLVPSQTELLSYLGLNTEVVGITKFCVHPQQWFKTKERVGGTKSCKIDKIRLIRPTLIIANKEENSKADIELLRNEYEVYTSNIISLKHVYQMIKDIGRLVDKQKASEKLIDQLQISFNNFTKIDGRVLYLIWKNPFMCAGKSTFINTMLQLIGLENAHFNNQRYDEISISEMVKINPDYVFLSSEPYPFKEKDINELASVLSAKIILIDGEMFSWYGSRLLNFKTYYLNTLLPMLK